MDMKRQNDKPEKNIQLNNDNELEIEYLSYGEDAVGNTAQGKKRSGNRKFPKKIIFASISAAAVLIMVSFAWWYYNSSRSVNTGNKDVMVPYYLYLLDENKSDYFKLQVVNMHPDETKRFVVCVSNKDKTDSELSYTVGRESEFNYELEFAYTQNIPLDYSVYELAPVVTDDDGNVKDEDKLKDLVYMDTGSVWERIKDVGDNAGPLQMDLDTSAKETDNNNNEMYGDTDVVNIGKYDVYTIDAGGRLMQLKTSYNGTETVYEYDYYLVEINWKDDVTNFGKYLKETDLVYVIVKALQPKPEEKETP